MYKLVIPNREVREVFVLQIQEWFRECVVDDDKPMRAFCQAFIKREPEEIQKRLNVILNRMLSVLDAKAPDDKILQEALQSGMREVLKNAQNSRFDF